VIHHGADDGAPLVEVESGPSRAQRSDAAGQRERERAALAGLALDPEASAVELDELPSDPGSRRSCDASCLGRSDCVVHRHC